MNTRREAAVSGQFYPASANELVSTINHYLADAREYKLTKRPRAIIVPHAGYIYSGPVAATAFKQIAPYASQIKRVLLLGPTHHVSFDGIATTSADSYHTPLGDISLDQKAIHQLEKLPQVKTLDQAHQWEHSLEVQLPFLQQVLGNFTLIPLVVGPISSDKMAAVINPFMEDDNTIIVVSSDLSHYYDYASAQKLDQTTALAIEQLDDRAISDERACGRYPLKGLLLAARKHHLHSKTLDLKNSGDTAGSRNQVVGYGAWVIY